MLLFRLFLCIIVQSSPSRGKLENISYLIVQTEMLNIIFASSCMWYALPLIPNIKSTPDAPQSQQFVFIPKRYMLLSIILMTTSYTQSKNKHSKSGKPDVYGVTPTCTCIVVLSKALNNKGRTSDRMSSRGVFSNITWRFSKMVTVAWIDLGAINMALWMHNYIWVWFLCVW